MICTGILLVALFAFFSLAACNLWSGKTDQYDSTPTEQSKTGFPDGIPQENTTGMVSKEYLTGRFDPATHTLFAEIPLKFATRGGMFLRREALAAFERLHSAAALEGHDIRILSATRNFDYQSAIWTAKWTGKRLLSDGTNAALDIADPIERALRILEYSAMPGTSRHHWGTDIDINALENAYFESGDGRALFKWMEEHAAEYGYCRPYTAFREDRTTGYNEEKWHWSYTPLSSKFLSEADEGLENSHITGFPGAETASHIDVVRKYVLGVSPNCK